jgi:hypothetical protein
MPVRYSLTDYESRRAIRGKGMFESRRYRGSR